MAENEKSTREQLEETRLLKERQRLQQESIESQQQTYEKAESAKQKTEFARYKQDCRKRALDLVHHEFISGKIDSNAELNAAGTHLIANSSILNLADKYYNWLISIPEK